jgi:hypothetical protein
MPAKYAKGEAVVVFYRCGENDSYMPVASHAQGLKTPRVGQTHGWVPATVVEAYDEAIDGPQGVAAWALGLRGLALDGACVGGGCMFACAAKGARLGGGVLTFGLIDLVLMPWNIGNSCGA